MFRKFAFYGGALISFVLVWVFGFKENATGTTAAGATMFVLLVFAELERFSKFKFPGGSAELRDTIEKAQVTMEQMRSLAEALAAASVTAISGVGRYASPDDRYFRIIGEIEKNLKELGISRQKIEEVLGPWYDAKLHDHVYVIRDMTRAIPDATPKGTDIWNNLFVRGSFDPLPKPEELTERLESCGILTNEVILAIKDYQHYLEKKELRRPEVWLRRQRGFRD